MTISARAAEKRRRAGRHILTGHCLHVALDLHFAFVYRQINGPVETRLGGHIAKQGINIFDANAFQHCRAIGIVQRQITHQSSSSI